MKFIATAGMVLILIAPAGAQKTPSLIKSTATIILKPAEDKPVLQPAPAAAPVEKAKVSLSSAALPVSGKIKEPVEQAKLSVPRTAAVSTAAFSKPAPAISSAAVAAVKPEAKPVPGPVPSAAKPAAASVISTTSAAAVKSAAKPAAPPVSSSAAKTETKSAAVPKPAVPAVVPSAAPKPAAPAVFVPMNGEPEPMGDMDLIETITVAPESKPGFLVVKNHTIAAGETLWAISDRYYGDPFRWGAIYAANMRQVDNPDIIKPEVELVIPGISEIVKPAPAAAPEPEAASPAPGPAAEEETAAEQPPARSGTPEPPLTVSADKTPGPEAADLSEEMPEDQREWTPDLLRIVPDGWKEDGLIVDKLDAGDDSMADSLTEIGDRVKVRIRHPGAFKPGAVLAVYIKGGTAYDKKTGEELGRELQKTGLVRILSVAKKTAEARVIRANTSLDKGQVIAAE